MKTYNKSELIALLKLNNQMQPKAKYSNNTLLQMLDNVANDFVASLEPSKEKCPVNRGSLCEVLIGFKVCGKTSKSQAGKSDLNTLKLSAKELEFYGLPKSSNIEIKFSTGFAPATAKTSKAHWTILAGQNGLFLIESKNIIATPAGKININKQNPRDMVYLKNLSRSLGF